MEIEQNQEFEKENEKQIDNQMSKANTKNNNQGTFSSIFSHQSIKSKSYQMKKCLEDFTNFQSTDEYSQLHKQFMTKVINYWKDQKLTIKKEQQLAALGIYILDYSTKQESQKNGKVSFDKEEDGFRTIKFQALVAGFKIYLKGKNIDQDYLPKMEQKGFDEGSFGICAKIQGSQLCIKAIKNYEKIQNFKKTENIYRQEQFKYFDTEQHLLQIGLTKLASALEIAPQFHKIEDEYDFIRYNDCTIFLTEFCTPYMIYREQQQDKNNGKLPEDFNQKLQMQIGKCLLKLHSCKIVHHDVKPQNIVFSKKKKEFVLIDFGISRAYPQNHKQVAKIVSLSGTYNFLPQEVKEVFLQKKHGLHPKNIHINVYYLDVFALKQTIQWDYYGCNQYIKKRLQTGIKLDIPNDYPNQLTKQKFMKRTIGYELETLQKLTFNNSNSSQQLTFMNFLKKYNKNNQQVYQLYQSQGKIKQAMKHYLLIMRRCQIIQEKYQNKSQQEIKTLKNLKTVETLNSPYRLSKLMRQSYKPGYQKYEKMFEQIIQQTLYKNEIDFDFYFLIKDILHFHRGVLQGEPIINRIKYYCYSYFTHKNISKFVKQILLYIHILNPKNSKKYLHIIQYVWQILQDLFIEHYQKYSQIAFSCIIFVKTYYPTIIEEIKQNRKLRFDDLLYQNQEENCLNKKDFDRYNEIQHESLDVLQSKSQKQSLSDVLQSKSQKQSLSDVLQSKGQKQSLSASFIKSGTGVNHIQKKEYQKAQRYLNQAQLGKHNMRFHIILFILVRVHTLKEIVKADKQYQKINEILEDIPKEDLERQLYHGIFHSCLKDTVLTQLPIQIDNQNFFCLALASCLYFRRDYNQIQNDLIQVMDIMPHKIKQFLQFNDTGKQQQLGKQQQNSNINRKQYQFGYFYAVACILHIELIRKYKNSENKQQNKGKQQEQCVFSNEIKNCVTKNPGDYISKQKVLKQNQ